MKFGGFLTSICENENVFQEHNFLFIYYFKLKLFKIEQIEHKCFQSVSLTKPITEH